MRNARENVNVLDRKIRNLYAEAERIKNMKKSCGIPTDYHSR